MSRSYSLKEIASGFLKAFSFLRQYNVRLDLSLPARTDVVIYDSEGSDAISPLLLKYNYFVFSIRDHCYSLLVAILVIFRHRTAARLYHYYAEYIRLTRAKCVVTHIDNNPNFYLLKHLLPGTVFIAVQNGWRDNILFTILKSDYRRHLFSADYIFTFNPSLGALYQSLIRSNIVAHGSLKSNSYQARSAPSFDIVFISQVGPAPLYKQNKPYMTLGHSSLSYDDFYKPDKELIARLVGFSSLVGCSLAICGRTNNQDIELDFYAKQLGSSDFSFIPNDEKIRSIDLAMSAGLVVFIDSTLGLEVLSLGQKCAIFSTRAFDQSVPRSFGWELNLCSEGLFWSSDPSLCRFDSVIEYCFYEPLESWRKANQGIVNSVIRHDIGNRQLRSCIDNSFRLNGGVKPRKPGVV